MFSISIREIGLKALRGKLVLPLPVRDYVARLGEVERVRILPLTEATWLLNLELQREHRDPADRTIVATASQFGCQLITSDRVIQSFDTASVWQGGHTTRLRLVGLVVASLAIDSMAANQNLTNDNCREGTQAPSCVHDLCRRFAEASGHERSQGSQRSVRSE
ncbi:MAG: type II toxin-antitoxin system VapC family toxin [Syntrophobacteraceae bacterium]